MGDEGADHLPSENAALTGLRRNGPDPEIQPTFAYDIPSDWQGDFAPGPMQFQDSSLEEEPTSQLHTTPVKLTFEPNRFPLNH